MDLLFGGVGAGRTAIAYRPDGTTKIITFREWDELFEQAKAWDAVRINIPGHGWFVNFQGEWYWL